jgi:hypothetical protein
VLDLPTWTAPSSVPYNSTGTIFEIDVTTSIQNAADGLPFEGFLIKFAEEVPNDDTWFSFWSSEHTGGVPGPTSPPQLVVDYSPVGPATCAEAIAQGFGLRADFNNDCHVEWADFGIFAGMWMQCIDPQTPGCDEPWLP